MARIGNAMCGQTMAMNGRYRIEVRAAATQAGCGTVGASVTFTVDGMPANEMGTFRTGLPVTLPLSAGGAAAPAMPPADERLALAATAPCAPGYHRTAGAAVCGRQRVSWIGVRSSPGMTTLVAPANLATLGETTLDDVRIARTRPTKMRQGGSDTLTLTLHIKDQPTPPPHGNPQHTPQTVEVETLIDRGVALRDIFGSGYEVVVVGKIGGGVTDIQAFEMEEQSLDRAYAQWRWTAKFVTEGTQGVTMSITLVGKSTSGIRSETLCCAQFTVDVKEKSPWIEIGTIKVGSIFSGVLGSLALGMAGWMKQRMTTPPPPLPSPKAKRGKTKPRR